MVYKIFIPTTYSKESTFSLHDFPFLPKPILVLNVYSHWTFFYSWPLRYVLFCILVSWRIWGKQGIGWLTQHDMRFLCLLWLFDFIPSWKDFIINCSCHPSVTKCSSSFQKILPIETMIIHPQQMPLSVDLRKNVQRESPVGFKLGQLWRYHPTLI